MPQSRKYFRKIGYTSETRRDIKMLSKGLFIKIKIKKYFTKGSSSYSHNFQDRVERVKIWQRKKMLMVVDTSLLPLTCYNFMFISLYIHYNQYLQEKHDLPPSLESQNVSLSSNTTVPEESSIKGFVSQRDPI